MTGYALHPMMDLLQNDPSWALCPDTSIYGSGEGAGSGKEVYRRNVSGLIRVTERCIMSRTTGLRDVVLSATDSRL